MVQVVDTYPQILRQLVQTPVQPKKEFTETNYYVIQQFLFWICTQRK
jgi:hypothetical protein